MGGFEWKDVRGVEGTGFVRALRTILTSHLPQLLPRVNDRMVEEVRAQLLEHSRGGKLLRLQRIRCKQG